MRPEQWLSFRRAARLAPGPAPVALIVDSPWMPGYAGISHLDYFLNPDLWFETNLRIHREFPEIIFFPSWWVEYGMAIEPSAFGARLHFYGDRTPDMTPTLPRIEDAVALKPANPLEDGLMPFALQLYRRQKDRVFGAGYTMPVVAARGPLCLAGFLRGVTTFMTDIVETPDEVHKLLALTTKAVIDWLSAQAEAIGPSVEGILVLDDIVGFLSPRAYRQFAHPYLKQICDAFPVDWVKVYHNDANTRPLLADLPDTGFHVLNWSDKIPFEEARQKSGGRLCLMGNVAPLEIGVRGTPDQVAGEACKLVQVSNGSGLILSVGGGVSPGMPAANIRALASAVA